MSIPTFQTTTELLGPSRFIRQLACVIFAAASATAAQWRVNVQYSLNFTVKQLRKFIDIRIEELYSQSINQSIKTHFYSAICRERIRGAENILANDVISILRRDR